MKEVFELTREGTPGIGMRDYRFDGVSEYLPPAICWEGLRDWLHFDVYGDSKVALVVSDEPMLGAVECSVNDTRSLIVNGYNNGYMYRQARHALHDFGFTGTFYVKVEE